MSEDTETEISNAPLGEVATKLLHEDDRVKIWEMTLAPGEETAPHRHEHDYVIVVIEGDKVAAIPHVESTGASAHYIEAEVTPGAHFVLKKGGVEVARNIGRKYYRELLIELKD